jgi:hypothetical protein
MSIPKDYRLIYKSRQLNVHGTWTSPVMYSSTKKHFRSPDKGETLNRSHSNQDAIETEIKSRKAIFKTLSTCFIKAYLLINPGSKRKPRGS